MMTDLTLTGDALKKVFNRRVIFHDISFSLTARQTLLITGRNGAGKSTLVKIISGVLSPSAGSVSFRSASGSVPGPVRAALIGFVAPYLMIYDEFTARENLQLALGIRGLDADDERADALLDEVALYERRNDLLRTFSSGMRQRVKYALALIHRPPVLVLDEPMANLDGAGVALVRRIMDRHRAEGILIVATNERSDLDHADVKVNLDDP